MAFDITQLPQDVLDKLKNTLRFGKGAAPAGAQGNVPTNPDLNPDYQREPGGLLKRGAALAQPSPMDATQAQGTPAPTLTPTTPQGQTQQPATGGAAPKPQLTDAQWAQQNPGATPPPPTPFTPPSFKSRLAHTLMYGALEGVKPAIEYNQNISTQEKASQTAQQNYPQTLHAARGKEEMAQADLANKQATTANLQSEVANRGVPKNADEQLTKAIGEKDQRTIDTVIATKAQIWKTEHPDDQTPKDAFQLFMKSWATQHPDNPTPKYEDFQAAQQAEAEAKAKAERDAKATVEPGTWTLEEGEGGKPVLFNSKTGETKDAPPGIQAHGTEAKKQADYEKNVAPVQGALQFAEDYEKKGIYTGPSDEALMDKFFELAKPTTGFRMTQPQQDMLKQSTDYMNSWAAKYNHLMHGTWFANEQRKQIVQTMKELGDAKLKAAQPQGAPGAAAPGLTNFHVNPQTHQRIGWDGKAWVPAPPQ